MNTYARPPAARAHLGNGSVFARGGSLEKNRRFCEPSGVHKNIPKMNIYTIKDQKIFFKKVLTFPDLCAIIRSS